MVWTQEPTKRRTMRPRKRYPALLPADPSLSEAGKVLSGFSVVAAMAKKIEPVGK